MPGVSRELLETLIMKMVVAPLQGLARCGRFTQAVGLGWLGTGLWPLALISGSLIGGELPTRIDRAGIEVSGDEDIPYAARPEDGSGGGEMNIIVIIAQRE